MGSVWSHIECGTENQWLRSGIHLNSTFHICILAWLLLMLFQQATQQTLQCFNDVLSKPEVKNN